MAFFNMIIFALCTWTTSNAQCTSNDCHVTGDQGHIPPEPHTQSLMADVMRVIQMAAHRQENMLQQLEERVNSQFQQQVLKLEELCQTISEECRRKKKECVDWNTVLYNSSYGESSYKDCYDWLAAGYNTSGVYIISIQGANVEVYCDMETDGGGWTVIQRRFDGSVYFYRGWQYYTDGFGNVSTEYWLGNTNIHHLTSLHRSELRVELESFGGEKSYAQYDSFYVGPGSTNFTLQVCGYSGTAGDSLGDEVAKDWGIHSGQQFTTFDRDNDSQGTRNCAKDYSGAWWYNACYWSNLNGRYLDQRTFKAMVWRTWKDEEGLKATKMMMRARQTD